MKAVYYHADSHMAWGGNPPPSGYQKLAERFNDQCHRHGIQTVHLTCDGQPGWGDENRSFPLDPRNIVANREEAFTAYLETAEPGEWYWFCEPDFQILQPFSPPGDCDAVFLFRQHDDVPMCPAWRLATTKALPVYQRLREAMRADPRKDWHGDSAAFTKVWKEMGKPEIKAEYLGVKIRMWRYPDFIKPGKYTSNKFGKAKFI